MPVALNIATDAQGGYLFEEQYGDLLIDAINAESAVAQVARIDRLRSKRQKYAVYSGTPSVSVVSEGAEKPVTDAAFSQLTLNVKKLAAIVVYTEEILEDAAHDPRPLINADLVRAFALKIDALALGYENGAAIVSDFDSELGESTQTTELGSGGDAFALAVSQAMEKVEANGYDPTAVVAARDIRASLRDARQTVETAQPVYTQGFNQAPDTLYGLPLRYTKNLDAFPAGAGKKAAVVGDFRQAILGIRTDLRMKVSDQATVNIGGTQHNLWQRNEVAVLWEMRAGFVAHDLNRAFAVITNAS